MKRWMTGMTHALMAGRAIVLGEPGVDALQALLVQARLLPTGAAASSAPNLTTLYAAALAASRLRDFDTAAALCARLQAIVASDVRAARAARLLSIELAMLAGRPAQAGAISRPSPPTKSMAATCASAR